MVRPIIRGIPTVEWPKLAAEHFENTPEALRLKRAVATNRTLRESKLKEQLRQIDMSRELDPLAKVTARREAQAKARLAEASDTASAQLEAYRQEYGQQVQRNLKDAFAMNPADANKFQEINYQPGTSFTGDIGMSGAEMVRTAKDAANRNGTPFTTEQEIAALRAKMPGRMSTSATLVPQELADRYSAEKASKLAAFDEQTATNAREEVLAKQAATRSHNAVKRQQAIARGEGPPRIDMRDFASNAGGTIERGDEKFVVAPHIGPYEQAQPYGQSPDEFVKPPAVRRVLPRGVPAYPTVSPTGRTKPSASILDWP